MFLSPLQHGPRVGHAWTTLGEVESYDLPGKPKAVPYKIRAAKDAKDAKDAKAAMTGDGGWPLPPVPKMGDHLKTWDE